MIDLSLFFSQKSLSQVFDRIKLDKNDLEIYFFYAILRDQKLRISCLSILIMSDVQP